MNRRSSNTRTIANDGWNIIDIRFFSIWFVISNTPGFLEKYKYVEGMYTKGLFESAVATFILLLLIPIILLYIAENTPIKRFFLKLFKQLNWLYNGVGWISFAIMFVYLILFTIEKLGVKIPL